MFCFNSFTRYIANLYAEELLQLIMGRTGIGILCSFIKAWRLGVWVFILK
jgi:hypothetical protein